MQISPVVSQCHRIETIAKLAGLQKKGESEGCDEGVCEEACVREREGHGMVLQHKKNCSLLKLKTQTI